MKENAIEIEKTDLLSTIKTNSVDANNKTLEQLSNIARDTVNVHHVCLIKNFQTSPTNFIEFVEQFGRPLENYSSLSELSADDPDLFINRVRYKRKADYVKKSVHYLGGQLVPHSARSWRRPRPRYFAMLMVNPGWLNYPKGQQGESTLLRWNDLFEHFDRVDPVKWRQYFSILKNTPITFYANNVKEDTSSLPLIYPITDDKDHDYGVRLKQDLVTKIGKYKEEIEDYETYKLALDYFVAGTKRSELQANFPMRANDLVIIDNNRVAHGRQSIVGEDDNDGIPRTNPRELWSVAVE